MRRFRHRNRTSRPGGAVIHAAVAVPADSTVDTVRRRGVCRLPVSQTCQQKTPLLCHKDIVRTDPAMPQALFIQELQGPCQISCHYRNRIRVRIPFLQKVRKAGAVLPFNCNSPAVFCL